MKTLVVQVNASDGDNDDLTYSLTGTDASSLQISPSGALSFKSAPDYESKTSYSVTVNVSDGSYTVSQVLTIDITNVNDNDPAITSSATFSAAENQTAVGTVLVTDLDGDNLTFSLSSPAWTQRGDDIDGEAADDYSGQSVSLSEDGDTVAIGADFNDDNGSAAGHVRIYDWDGSSWTQRGDDIDGEAAGDVSGGAVSLSEDGDTVAISAALNGFNVGHVRIYDWDGSSWTQRGDDIDGEAADDLSGWSVSLSEDGDTVAIGAVLNDGNGTDAGHVRIYDWDGSSWTKRGDDIDGEAANDFSGYSVSLNEDGDTVAIGARSNDGNGTDAGHVRIYDWDGSSWTKRGDDIDGEAANDFSGWSVSLSEDGDTVAIGARLNDGNGTDAGHVRIYDWDGSSWIKRGDDIDGEAADDQSGYSVSLNEDGDTVAISARLNDGNGTDAGHVRIYDWDGSSWIKRGDDIDGEAASDESGYSVSLNEDGDTVAIGAYSNDGNGTDAGHVRIYDWSGDAASFSIDSSGVLTFDSAPDFETKSSYEITVEVSDGTNSVSQVLTIDITNVNDNPAITSSATFSAAENQTAVGTVLVTDLDGDNLTFSLSSDDAWTTRGDDIDGEAASDESGRSVSMSDDGDTVVIGAIYNGDNGIAAGHVRIYDWDGSSWTQRGDDIDGEAAFDESGQSVSLSEDGDTVAIGGAYNDGNGTDAGHVRIYDWDGSSWTQRGDDIDGEAANDFSGISILLSEDGDTVAIGGFANDDNGTNAGHVRIYDWDGSSWTQRGDDIDGEAANDFSGISILLSEDGDTVAIGAPLNDDSGSNAGHVRIYDWDGSSWTQRGDDIDGEAAGDVSGRAVSLSEDGDTVAIDAFANDGSGSNAGHVRIYDWDGSSWTKRGDDIDGEAAFDESGWSVSLNEDGDTVAIGATGNDGNGNDAGHVRIYDWDGSSWTKRGDDIDGEAANDNSGYSVSLNEDGDTVAIGAIFNDGSGGNAGHVRIYDWSGDADSFSIDSSGVLTFDSAPDFETKSSYEITVEVSDGTNTVSQALTINVTDVVEP